MSRTDAFDGDVDEKFPAHLWDSWYSRSLKGKRGQKNLRDFIAALDAMPEKRLIADAEVEKHPVDDEREYEVAGVCAVACFAASRGEDPRWFGGEEDSDIFTTAELGKNAGLSWTMAWEMARANDDVFSDSTPEERWQKMRDWAVARLQPFPASA